MSLPTHIVIPPEHRDLHLTLLQLADVDQSGMGIWQVRDGADVLGHIVARPEVAGAIREAFAKVAALRRLGSSDAPARGDQPQSEGEGAPGALPLSSPARPLSHNANVASDADWTPERWHNHMAGCSVCQSAGAPEDLCETGAILRVQAITVEAETSTPLGSDIIAWDTFNDVPANFENARRDGRLEEYLDQLTLRVVDPASRGLSDDAARFHGAHPDQDVD